MVSYRTFKGRLEGIGGLLMKSRMQTAGGDCQAALEYWDILGLVKYDAYVYEDQVLWLLQNLAHIADRRSVEDALQDLFTEPETFLPLSPEQTLAIKFLADEVWNLWTAYLQRREQYAVTHTQSRARMRQHAFPMSTIR